MKTRVFYSLWIFYSRERLYPSPPKFPTPGPSQSSHRSPSRRFGWTVELWRMHTPHPPPHHHSRAFPAATQAPCREGYNEPGQHGGQLPAAELPVPAAQLPQEQLGVRLGHGGGRAPLSRGGGGGKGAARSHKAPRARKRKRLHVGEAGNGPERQTGRETLPEPLTRAPPQVCALWKAESAMRVLAELAAVLIPLPVPMVCEMGSPVTLCFNKLKWLESGFFRLQNS